MVINKFGGRLYDGLVATQTAHLARVAAGIAAVPGSGDELLRALKAGWDHHAKSMAMVRDILMYMDRIYVPHAGVAPVHALGRALWRDGVVRHPAIGGRARAAALAAAAAERTGGSADRALVRAYTSMLADLGADVYENDFEAAFLAEAGEFYAGERAAAAAAGTPPPVYLAAAEARLAEEAARVGHYLDPGTGPKLTAVVEGALLAGAAADDIVGAPVGGLVSLLEAGGGPGGAPGPGPMADLARMHRLLGRVEGGHDRMRAALGAHVRAAGGALAADPGAAADPPAWVGRALAFKARFDAVVVGAWGGDKAFTNAVNAACEAWLNQAPRAPEFLSLFIDDRLRRGGRGGGPGEEAGGGGGGEAAEPTTAAAAADAAASADDAVWDRALTLFRFLADKDVFERYYKQHLARRLLSAGRSSGGSGNGPDGGGLSASPADEAERGLLARLKAECGYQFTSKLESMFTDMKTSRDLMADYRAAAAAGRAGGGKAGEGGPASSAGPDASASAAPPVDLSVQVLTTGSWPTPAPSACVLPPHLTAACDAFAAFYLAKHGGRKLAWQAGLGSADVRASGFASGKRHELSVSTYQMVLLLQFNAAPASGLTAAALGAATGIPAPDLTRALQSLACVRGKNVLTKSPAGKAVAPTDVFTANAGFTSRLFKVKIGTVSASRAEADPNAGAGGLGGPGGDGGGLGGTRARAEGDRKPQVDAALVRCMKARRAADHGTLVAEVTRQLAGRFVPPPALVKQRIESLIEREFLERDANDRKLYRYLA
jgi:cullin 3